MCRNSKVKPWCSSWWVGRCVSPFDCSECLLNCHHHLSPMGKSTPPQPTLPLNPNTNAWPPSPAWSNSLTLGRPITPSQLAPFIPITPPLSAQVRFRPLLFQTFHLDLDHQGRTQSREILLSTHHPHFMQENWPQSGQVDSGLVPLL